MTSGIISYVSFMSTNIISLTNPPHKKIYIICHFTFLHINRNGVLYSDGNYCRCIEKAVELFQML